MSTNTGVTLNINKKADRVWSILIIGYGVVGGNLYAELSKGKNLNIDIVDKYKPECNTTTRGNKKYDIAFVCVDTPRTAETACECREVANAIAENDAEVYVIKSTVLPGTTNGIRAGSGKRVVFSPEYYGGTQHCNNFDFPFTIIGGPKADCKEVVQMLQNVYDARHQFRITDSDTAELVKYMENAYLATKVSFCNQFFQIAEQIGVDYEELRELFVLDERVDPAHTFVYRDKPYWESHCLDKDVPAIAEAFNAPFLREVIGFNDYCKERYRKQRSCKDARMNCRHNINPIGPGTEAKPESEAKRLQPMGNVVVIGMNQGAGKIDPKLAKKISREVHESFDAFLKTIVKDSE